jgi:hypothetical protein
MPQDSLTSVGIGNCNLDFDPPSSLPPGHWVATKTELLDALSYCASHNGGIIYILFEESIDMSGSYGVVIPANTHIRGNRGKARIGSDGVPASEGGRIFTTTRGLHKQGLFVTGGTNIKISGIRLEGPDPDIGTDPYDPIVGCGIVVYHDDIEIYNCEIYNWAHAGIHLRDVYNTSRDTIYIHHNYFHHCHRTQLGYGVGHCWARSLIEYNAFDYCRHAIAGWGKEADGYEACYNWVGPHMSGHSFDMHGGADRQDGTDIAGSEIRIHNNTFETTVTVGEVNKAQAVFIGGIPTVGCYIYDNWFYHNNLYGSFYKDMAIYQDHDIGHFWAYDNYYRNPKEPAPDYSNP